MGEPRVWWLLSSNERMREKMDSTDSVWLSAQASSALAAQDAVKGETARRTIEQHQREHTTAKPTLLHPIEAARERILIDLLGCGFLRPHQILFSAGSSRTAAAQQLLRVHQQDPRGGHSRTTVSTQSKN